MGRRGEHADDEILVLHRHAGAALAAAVLRAVGGERRALDVAAMRDSHDHVLDLDQVFVVHVGAALREGGAARHGELGLHLVELALDNLKDARARAEDIEQVGDLGGKAACLVADLVAAEACEAVQRQVQDGASLFVGQVNRTVIRSAARAPVGD